MRGQKVFFLYILETRIVTSTCNNLETDKKINKSMFYHSKNNTDSNTEYSKNNTEYSKNNTDNNTEIWVNEICT